jgi:hypothetical protein
MMIHSSALRNATNALRQIPEEKHVTHRADERGSHGHAAQRSIATIALVGTANLQMLQPWIIPLSPLDFVS